MEINESPVPGEQGTPSLHMQVWEYALTRRRIVSNVNSKRILSPEDTAQFFHGLELHHSEQEHLIAVMLDAKNSVKAYSTVCIGLIDRSPMHAREVFRKAIISGASRVLLAHNHPSGDPKPSQGDIASTRQLVEAGKVVGIEIVDHVIVVDPDSTGPAYASLRELGYI